MRRQKQKVASAARQGSEEEHMRFSKCRKLVLARLGGLGSAVCLTLVMAGSPGNVAAQGSFQAIQSYTTDGTLGYLNGTLGWSFQPTTFITLTGLGCFTNAIGSEGMAVGLWKSDGSLLASNLVTTLSDLAGLSRYESTAPIFLDPGQTYFVGAYNPSGLTSLDIYIPGTTQFPLIVSPDIVIGQLASGNGGFVFPPAVPGTGGYVYLGPNFTFTERVPEPSSLALAGIAGLLCAVWRRR
jgi:hypothetical protein